MCEMSMGHWPQNPKESIIEIIVNQTTPSFLGELHIQPRVIFTRGGCGGDLLPLVFISMGKTVINAKPNHNHPQPHYSPWSSTIVHAHVTSLESLKT